jgi:hypothetical protein
MPLTIGGKAPEVVQAFTTLGAERKLALFDLQLFGVMSLFVNMADDARMWREWSDKFDAINQRLDDPALLAKYPDGSEMRREGMRRYERFKGKRDGLAGHIRHFGSLLDREFDACDRPVKADLEYQFKSGWKGEPLWDFVRGDSELMASDQWCKWQSWHPHGEPYDPPPF